MVKQAALICEVFKVSNYSATNYSLSTALPLPAEPLSKGMPDHSQTTLPPALVQDYAGRVSTFFNGAKATYSETYEPARKLALGDVWRVESRLVAGRWLHLAYSCKGLQIGLPTDGAGMFEQEELPLLFDPDRERQFALALLAANPKVEIVRLGEHVLVYGSKKDSSVGIVRDRTGQP